MKRIYIIFYLLFPLTLFSQSEYKEKSVPSIIANKYINVISLPKNIGKAFYLDKIITNGKKDYTSIIQKAINENSVIIFPNYTININKNGLKIPSNRILYFQKNSKIKFLGPADSRDSDILKIYNSKNVMIYNPKIVGSKLSKDKQWGEWSAGIAILGAENIEIKNFNISNTYGDGIIIGNQSKGIKINGGWIDKARRNGISITSGIDLNLENIVISNTNGTLPMCGIQIEPDFPSDNLSNINISNIIGYNNRNTTFVVNLGPLNQVESKFNNTILITANYITDYYSDYVFSVVKNADMKSITPKGVINISNVLAIGSKNLYWSDNGSTNVKLKTKNVKDSNGKLKDIN